MELHSHWRLIISPPSTGAFNMALDEVFLILSSNKVIPPTLRLYSWNPPTLSLGYAQKSSDVNITALEKLGWDLVRRPTGGKAILHIDELTYSITAPVDDPLMQGSLLESYQCISAILQKALEELGVITLANHQYPKKDENSKINPVCFEVPSNFEITCQNKKLIGSAQARKSGGVLQHGSLPLHGDLGRITQVLNYANELHRQNEAQKILDRAITLSDAAGRPIEWQETSLALINVFSKQLNIIFDQSEPTSHEKAMAEDLVKTKYTSNEWSLRL